MSELIPKTGLFLFNLNQRYKRFFVVMDANPSFIPMSLSLSIVSASVVFLSSLPFYPIGNSIIYALTAFTVSYVACYIAASFFDFRSRENESIYYRYQFKKKKLNRKELEKLGFVKNVKDDSVQEKKNREQIKNINLLLINVEPDAKIDFLLVVHNGHHAGDYMKLLRILHLLIKGGIFHFKDERKKELYEFIENTFTMNGKKVMRSTLKSRFSDLVTEPEDKFEPEIKEFKKILSL